MPFRSAHTTHPPPTRPHPATDGARLPQAVLSYGVGALLGGLYLVLLQRRAVDTPAWPPLWLRPMATTAGHAGTPPHAAGSRTACRLPAVR